MKRQAEVKFGWRLAYGLLQNTTSTLMCSMTLFARRKGGDIAQALAVCELGPPKESLI